MRKTIIKVVLCLLFLTAGKMYSQSAAKSDECYNCHQLQDGKLGAPAESFTNDIHRKAGVTCAGCHGGDATSGEVEGGMNRLKGYIGIPAKKDRYMTCVRCHADHNKMASLGYRGSSDQFEKLKNSVHFHQSYDNQGPIADCITCHGAHGILAVNNPQSRVAPGKVVALCGGCHSDAAYMKKYNPSIAVDQVMKYRTSVHGMKNAQGDNNAAECANCHGHHDIRAVKDAKSSVYNANIAATCSKCHSDAVKMARYKIPTNQYEKYKNSVHGVALMQKGDAAAPSCNGCHGNHGAVPPGVESISKVCGACHAQNMELFEKSPHKAAFDQKKLPECESCHGNHDIAKVSDEMLGVGTGATCIRCHTKGDKGYTAAAEMRGKMDKLNADQIAAIKTLNEADRLGMDVSDEQYSMKDIKQVIMKSKTAVHTFDPKKFGTEIEPGYEIASDAGTQGAKAIDDYYFRRKGLVVSTIIVSLLVVLIYVKLKRIEKQQKNINKA